MKVKFKLFKLKMLLIILINSSRRSDYTINVQDTTGREEPKHL